MTLVIGLSKLLFGFISDHANPLIGLNPWAPGHELVESIYNKCLISLAS